MDILASLLSEGGFLLVFALTLALAFEFVNGFHDTANAVATVIYTNSLPANQAVVWSGVWNLIGVLTSSGTVAFGIISLLPVELVLNVGSVAGFAMVFALLTAAMIWNLGTWYFGLPASSSHTLIGAILGVGLANSILNPGQFHTGINWSKAAEVGLSLLISPLAGFVLGAAMLRLTQFLVSNPELFQPAGVAKPPAWIRSTLILTCTGVSFAHGSNDGQKGMGLLMLILVGILPGTYAIDVGLAKRESQAIHTALADLTTIAGSHGTSAGDRPMPEDAEKVLTSFVVSKEPVSATHWDCLRIVVEHIRLDFSAGGVGTGPATENRKKLRTRIYIVTSTIQEIIGRSGTQLPEAEVKQLEKDSHSLGQLTKFIPAWVKIAVAAALGLGTMIGWKRIVVTVGEKIGKVHLSYAQGASAEIVAMATIITADSFGLPVSTTHVLSSGIAGTMVANHSGLQRSTVRNLLLAWILTFPVCVFLGALLFAMALNLLAGFGMH